MANSLSGYGETAQDIQQGQSHPSANSNIPETVPVEDEHNLMLEKLPKSEAGVDPDYFHRQGGTAPAEENAQAYEAKELYFLYGSYVLKDASTYPQRTQGARIETCPDISSPNQAMGSISRAS